MTGKQSYFLCLSNIKIRRVEKCTEAGETYCGVLSPLSGLSGFVKHLTGRESTTDSGAGTETIDKESDIGCLCISSNTCISNVK